jgi:hypothetical protein
MTVWEDACGKAAAQPRRFVEWEGFWRGQVPRLEPEKHLLYLGTHSTCYDDCCHRQLCDRSLFPFPPLSVIGPYLAGIAKGVDEPPAIDHSEMLHRRPPLFYDKATEGAQLTYVDLDSAYWSIYTRTTLDVHYDGTAAPRRGVIAFQDAAMLGRDKLVRNALLGSVRREWRHGLDHGHGFRERVPSRKRRPMLWGLVMDSLELVAMTARDLGCVYYHTDGAIFESPTQAEEWRGQVEQTFGLQASIRAEGAGWVRGIGNFSIGETCSSRPERTGRRVDSMLRAPYDLAQDLTAWLHDASLIAEGGPYADRGDPGTGLHILPPETKGHPPL